MIQVSAKYVITFLLSLFAILPAQAQYIDEFAAAGDVSVSDNGYGVGLFSSPSFPLALATLDQNEYFHQDLVQAGLIEKTLWFKFTIATRRNVTISLKQRDTLIAQQDIGFAVFVNPAGMAGPHNLAHEFPVMNKQGNTGYDCLEPGEYYVQVCSRLRAMDSVWIETRVSVPNNTYSDWDNSYKVEFAFWNNREFFNMSLLNCANIFSEEIRKLSHLQGDIAQINFRFVVDTGFDAYSVILDYTDNVWKPVGHYLLLKEDSTLPVSQWERIDTASIVEIKYRYQHHQHYGCINQNGLDPGIYRVVIFYELDDFRYLSCEIRRFKDNGIPHSTPLNLPPQYQHLDWVNKGAKDPFTCKNTIPAGICPNLNTDLYQIETNGDTSFFDKQTFYTYHIKNSYPVDGYVSISFPNFTNTPRPVFWLYKGDVQQTCQLSKIEKNSSFYCVDSGIYTLRVLFPKGYDYMNVKIGLEINSYPFSPVTAKFNDSLKPNNLGSIMNVLPQQLASEADYFDNTEQHLLVNKQMVKGAMKYTEFYVSSSMPYSILIEYPDPRQSPRLTGYLFKGRKSTGGANQFVEQFYHQKNYYCGNHDTGWYTLVIQYGIYSGGCGYTNNNLHSAIFSPTAETCPNQSSQGSLSNPYLINNGNPLTTDVVTVQGSTLAAAKTYQLPQICFQCSHQDTSYANWISSACSKNFNEGVSFFYAEFDLPVSSQFEIDNFFYPCYFIRGSLKQNPSLLMDHSKYLDPCDGRGVYCDVSPGKYTLVFYGLVSSFQSPSVHVVPMVDYPNDYLENFVDLGLIQGNVAIPPYSNSCAITADSSDFFTGNFYYYPDVHLGPYPPDKKLNAHYTPFSMWYYLELDGLGKLGLKLEREATLFEIPDSMDVSLLKNNPSLRTSYAIALIKRVNFSFDEQDTFYKGTCDKRRYFLMLNAQHEYVVAQPVASWTSITIPTQKADQCSSAKVLSVNQFGQSSGKLDVRCMTIGEGFGEDGNNMACLPLPAGYVPYVSAWYKIHIDPGTKYDVDFQIKRANGAYFGTNQIKYRILYGSCSALTPGPCVENLQSKFGFECMEAGDYFFQIVIPADSRNYASIDEQIEIVANVKPTAVSTCRPFDPDRPLASFNFDGHCEMDSVHFRNYSSQGSDIAYLWDFGDGRTSTLKDPVIWFQTIKTHEDFRVKLLVTNTAKQKSDSIERVVRIRNAPLRIDVPFTDTLIRCGSFISIVATPNFSDGTLFNFNPMRGDTVLGDRLEEHYNSTNSYVRFIAYASNCVVDTLVRVRIHQKLGILSRDSLLCTRQPIALDLSPYQQVTWWPQNLKSPKIVLSDTGTYWVTVNDSGCYLRDTIRLHDRRPVFNHALDTFLCSADSAQIMTLPQYTNWLWDNGQTTQSRWVYESGNYWVEGQWETCLNRDTVRVNFVELNDPLKQDADSFCKEGSLDLRSDIEAQTYIWNTRQSTRSINVNTTGTYNLNVYTAHCHASDSIRVVHYPADIRLGEDTGFCNEISLRLDAGLGSAYTWWPVSSTDRYFTVHDSGTYGVDKINQYGCIDADTIHVFENCGPYLLVPNAFTPNGDGLNDFLSWSIVDVTEFEIHIYNRWGEQVFNSTDVYANWDGTFKGEIAGEGLYIYRIVYGGEDFTGRYYRRNLKGTVLLIR